MKIATAAICLLAVLSVLAVPATGQTRIQFPTDAPLVESVPGSSNIGPHSPVTLEGIGPAPANWDPYGTAGPRSSTLLEQDPYLPFDSYSDMRQRLIKEIRFEYLWMPGNGANEFGINDLELSTTVTFPFLYNQDTPLLVTPGFAINYWQGPVGVPLPPRVYDAYLDAAWNPQIVPNRLSAELNFRIGVYSDFQRVTNESIRYMGQGFFLLALSPSFDVKAGVMYLDRNHVKLLPSGGLIWKPGPRVRFDVLFPNPKLAWQFTTWGNTEWWGYLAGDYGGDAWTVDLAGVQSLDYNDIRFALGVEFDHMDGLRTGFFEVGLAFERELYNSAADPYGLNNTVFLRGGVAF